MWMGLWSLASMAAIGVVGALVVLVIALSRGGLEPVMLLGLVGGVIGGGIGGILLWLLAMPFMFLSFKSEFYGRRLEGVLGVERPGKLSAVSTQHSAGGDEGLGAEDDKLTG